ncbi:MAG TPA: aldo/keto reductase [Paracoccus sp. (in: a-proteobacteria)]|uniref:aldo/keto reductase n=1 Tax=uncultured Paracoccus sp. TaxID=189685 RepID=UPI00262F769A|nr:aldo/keto reductase [uncultured Paracoccus sp.]HMQ41205.1 aldo/keto reductase [Paracoccus sp. (in: a-proteobacteria)]HMR35426.1 aldo/keto reductase [Paracoccus sp. (in: a-proteobacteria)]
MERIEIADRVTLSRMAYGMWRVADDDDTGPAHIRAKLEACLAQGITTLDLADIYGGYTAESLLGAALKAAPGLRDRFEIVTKCGIVAPMGRHGSARVKHYDTSARHIAASVDASLRDLGIDRIDLLLIHRPDPMMDAGETGRALDDLVESGKVRAVGVSNFHRDETELLQDAMRQRLRVNQIEISLAAPEPFANGELSFIQRQGMAPMAWSPLAGGALFAGAQPELVEVMRDMAAAKGCEMAALAIAWLLAHPARIMPVIGTNRLSRIAAMSEAFRVDLDREDWFILYQAALGHEVP